MADERVEAQRARDTWFLTELVGGPHDGHVVATSGERPAIMLGSPRPRSLLDEPIRRAVWCEKTRWYEGGLVE